MCAWGLFAIMVCGRSPAPPRHNGAVFHARAPLEPLRSHSALEMAALKLLRSHYVLEMAALKPRTGTLKPLCCSQNISKSLCAQKVALKPLCARNGCSEATSKPLQARIGNVAPPKPLRSLCVLALAASKPQATSKPLCIQKNCPEATLPIVRPDITASSTAKPLRAW